MPYVLAHLIRDLRIEWRSKDAINSMLFFALIIVVLFSLAFDPTRESTYEFLDKFIAEMAAFFPSPYLHIGADENNGAVWLANPSIVAFMQAHHLADPPALQAYFVRRVQEIVAKHGRRMVAWEDAYAPGQFKDSIFQVWSPLAKIDLTKIPMTNGNQVLVSRGPGRRGGHVD